MRQASRLLDALEAVWKGRIDRIGEVLAAEPNGGSNKKHDHHECPQGSRGPHDDDHRRVPTQPSSVPGSCGPTRGNSSAGGARRPTPPPSSTTTSRPAGRARQLLHDGPRRRQVARVVAGAHRRAAAPVWSCWTASPTTAERRTTSTPSRGWSSPWPSARRRWNRDDHRVSDSRRSRGWSNSWRWAWRKASPRRSVRCRRSSPTSPRSSNARQERRSSRRSLRRRCRRSTPRPNHTMAPEHRGDDRQQPQRPGEGPEQEVDADVLPILEHEREQQRGAADRRDRTPAEPAPLPLRTRVVLGLVVHVAQCTTETAREPGCSDVSRRASLPAFEDREIAVGVLVVPPLLAEHDVQAAHDGGRAAVG